MPSSSLKIINPLGLHARAASKFVALAKSFSSRVELSKAGEKVDGKSIMSVMLLAAPVGSEIILEVQGEDAEEAFTALSDLINDGFGELE
jgi:phosphocarrier protein